MAQDYDKIIKENLQESIPDFVEAFLGIPVPATEDVPLELQRTLERRPDFLKKVRFSEPEKDFILQVEAQSTDEEMRYRFMVYKGVLLEREQCPVTQVVLYFGDKPPTMLTTYEDSTMTSRFHLLNFKEIPYQHLLNMGKPGEIIFALLGDLNNKNPEHVLEEILLKLKQVAPGELQLKKYTVQLRVISKLRKLQPVLNKILNRMPLVIDMSDDIYYLKGKEIGLEKGLEEGLEKGQLLAKYSFVSKLLEDGNFTKAQIVKIADVSAVFIKKVEQELTKEAEVLALLKPRSKDENIAKKVGVSIEFVEYLRFNLKKKSKS
jgi:hypothetical protein